MTALIVIAAILLLFVLLAFIPLRIKIAYNDSVNIYLPILFFKIPIYPKKKRIKSLSAQKFRDLRKPESNSKSSKKSEINNADSKSKDSEKLTFKTIKPHLGEILSQVKSIQKFIRFISSFLPTMPPKRQ